MTRPFAITAATLKARIWPTNSRRQAAVRCAALALLLGAAGSAAAEQAPSEWEQKQACMGDAVRLCTWSIPDREKIIACMASKHDELSAHCRDVFDASMRARAAAATHKP